MVAVFLLLLGAQGVSSGAPAVAGPRDQSGFRTHPFVGDQAVVRDQSVVRDQPVLPRWSWPLQPTPGVVRPFDRPAQRWERGHRGVDLSPGAGRPLPVHSPDDGVVSFAGTVVDRGVLSIDHGDGRISSFEPVTTTLVRGDRVSRGQEVADLTNPGGLHCADGCLHWGVRVHGEYVDPLLFVLDARPSVLLPLHAESENRSRRSGVGEAE